MADCVWLQARAKAPVSVYVPGDGRRPYTAATVCLHTPSSWTVCSIDPVMSKEYARQNPAGIAQDKGGAAGARVGRLVCVRGTTEEFVLPDEQQRHGAAESEAEAAGEAEAEAEGDTEAAGEQGGPALSVVMAVHSHCPLSEFVSRIPGKLLVVSLPCCGECGVVEGVDGLDLLSSYSDPDILSPARVVHVHYRP